VLQCAALETSVAPGVLQCVAVCYSVLQCVAACCSVLQRIAVCCSVLQCVACPNTRARHEDMHIMAHGTNVHEVAC